MSRIDYPRNGTYAAAWTLDMSATNKVQQPPAGQAQAGEIPANCFDVRGCRGYAIEISPGTVTGGALQLELQWSITGTNWISMGATYRLAIAAGAPALQCGFIVDNPWYPWVRVVPYAAATSGTANLYLFQRN